MSRATLAARRPKGHSGVTMCGRLWRARAGTSAIETAFILPVLVAGTIGLVETGRLLWTQTSLQAAVIQAARCAAISPQNCSDVPSYAASTISWISVPKADFTYTSTASCGISGYSKGQQVVANYTFTTVVGTLIPKYKNIGLSASACHP